MLQTVLSRLAPAPASPTADLYFMNACSDFLNAGVTRLAPTVFASPGARLVMRHELGVRHPVGAAGAAGGRLIWFIDDAVEEGVKDASLPALYRQKLRLVERSSARRIGARAAVAVVGSAVLARRYSARVETRLIYPYWSEPLAGQEHFEGVERGEGWLDIAYLGGTAHRADLAFLWPVVGAVLAALAGHLRLRRIPGRGWAAYREGLAGRRFHLALYPLMDTPFNQARSVNKLIEHGVVGAAGLYSQGWGEAWRAAEAGAGLTLRNRPEEWLAAIEHLLARPAALRGLAAGAGALARRLNQAGPQRRLWARLMGVDLHVLD